MYLILFTIPAFSSSVYVLSLVISNLIFKIYPSMITFGERVGARVVGAGEGGLVSPYVTE